MKLGYLVSMWIPPKGKYRALKEDSLFWRSDYLIAYSSGLISASIPLKMGKAWYQHSINLDSKELSYASNYWVTSGLELKADVGLRIRAVLKGKEIY